MSIQIKVEEDLQYGLTSKVGSITVEHGVRGRELEERLRKAQEKFVRDMELRGFVLYDDLPGNPAWTTNEDGSMASWYAIDWMGERTKLHETEGGALPTKREESLEDSEGLVEYRIVGIFWGMQRIMEVLKDRDDILQGEQIARNPTVLGYGDKGSPKKKTFKKEYVD